MIYGLRIGYLKALNFSYIHNLVMFVAIQLYGQYIFSFITVMGVITKMDFHLAAKELYYGSEI
jgi:hypothetical protein